MRKAGNEGVMRHFSVFHRCGSNRHSGGKKHTHGVFTVQHVDWGKKRNKETMENGSNEEDEMETRLVQTFIPRIMKKLYGNSAIK